ncbi:hypothetical protein GQ457_05G020760 [Hibiscus cannabinus]
MYLDQMGMAATYDQKIFVYILTARRKCLGGFDKPGVSVIFINLSKYRSFNITLSNLKSEDEGKPNYEIFLETKQR